MDSEETKYWIHKDGWFYQGDKLKGAREATDEEIQAVMDKNKEEQESTEEDSK